MMERLCWSNLLNKTQESQFGFTGPKWLSLSVKCYIQRQAELFFHSIVLVKCHSCGCILDLGSSVTSAQYWYQYISLTVYWTHVILYGLLYSSRKKNKKYIKVILRLDWVILLVCGTCCALLFSEAIKGLINWSWKLFMQCFCGFDGSFLWS